MAESGEGIMLCGGRGLLRPDGALAMYAPGYQPCCIPMAPVPTVGGRAKVPWWLVYTLTSERVCNLRRQITRDISQWTNYTRLSSFPDEGSEYVQLVLNGTVQPSGTVPLYPGIPNSVLAYRVVAQPYHQLGGRIPIRFYYGGGKTMAFGTAKVWHYRTGSNGYVCSRWISAYCCNDGSGGGAPYEYSTDDPADMELLTAKPGSLYYRNLESESPRVVGESGLVTFVSVADGEHTTYNELKNVFGTSQHPTIHYYYSLPKIQCGLYGSGFTLAPYPYISLATQEASAIGSGHVAIDWVDGQGYRVWQESWELTDGYSMRPVPAPGYNCVYWNATGEDILNDSSGYRYYQYDSFMSPVWPDYGEII